MRTSILRPRKTGASVQATSARGTIAQVTATVTIVVFAALALGGCGGSTSEASIDEARPALTIPNDSVTPGESTKSTTGSTGATGDTGGDTGGGDTGADTGGTTDDNTGGADTGGTDNNTGNNNANNGGQQYDQFCQENPGACGD